MKRIDFWKLSFQNIFATPTRSVLTVLGMAIGIGAILAVLTLSDAGQVEVESEMARLGIDKVWITAAQGNSLKHGDAQLLSEALDTVVTEQVYAPVTARYGNCEGNGIAVGCTLDYMEIMDSHIIEGRTFYPMEWKSGSKSVLLGNEIAEELHIKMGDMLSVAGIPFRCIGIVTQKNELSQVDASKAIFIPVAVFCELMGQTVHELTLSVPKSTKPQAVAAMAVDVMATKRNITVDALTMQVQIEAANSVMAIFINVLKWIAVICILVGGIGVMNILLVSVRERRREIGIMKSLGTTQTQICMLFLLEALVYAVVGGMIGIIMGIGIIQIASSSIGLKPVIQVGDCISVFLSALFIGLFFGVMPASRASRLKPVDALRVE